MNSSICIKLYDIYSEFVLGYLTYAQCLKQNPKDERNNEALLELAKSIKIIMILKLLGKNKTKPNLLNEQKKLETYREYSLAQNT